MMWLCSMTTRYLGRPRLLWVAVSKHQNPHKKKTKVPQASKQTQEMWGGRLFLTYLKYLNVVVAAT